MLPQVVVGRHCCAQSTNPDNYRPLVGDDLIDELQQLARSLASVRICQINATSAGGGVAELLNGMIPILEAIGVHAEWRLIHGDAPFFEVTKAFHNALHIGRSLGRMILRGVKNKRDEHWLTGRAKALRNRLRTRQSINIVRRQCSDRRSYEYGNWYQNGK